MKNDRENPWDKIPRPSHGFDYVLVDNTHPLKLMWGISFNGDFLFCYEAPEIQMPNLNSFPELKGIKFNIIDHNSNKILILQLKDSKEWEIFKFLCTDLVRYTSSLDENDDIASIILGKLIRWQKFWLNDFRKRLSEAEIKGLIGELFFLRNQMARNFGWENAMKSWKGPEGAPQDFAIDDMAIEVKCQSGVSQQTVTISSVEQLQPQLPKGFLGVYTFANSSIFESEVFSLNQLVCSIMDELILESNETKERFEYLLDEAKYLNLDFYDKDLFQVVVGKVYRLGDDFPALKLDAIPSGVEKLRYSLNLGYCSEFEETPSWWK